MRLSPRASRGDALDRNLIRFLNENLQTPAAALSAATLLLIHIYEPSAKVLIRQNKQNRI